MENELTSVIAVLEGLYVVFMYNPIWTYLGISAINYNMVDTHRIGVYIELF